MFPRFALLASLMLIASASSATLTYKAACTGNNTVPPVSSKATGSVSITLLNQSYASGYFYATSIKQMTMAHLHAGAVGENGPPVVWAFNSTYGPISGSIKATFSFNPSLNNVSALLAAGLVYFNIHTTAKPAGELRGQLMSTSSPLRDMSLPSGSYSQTCSGCSMANSTLSCNCLDGNRKKEFLSTSLNTNICIQPPDIVNIQGYLRCANPQMPAGSYVDTCNGCTMSGSTLKCDCEDGTRVKSAELITNDCVQPPYVTNEDGMLRCPCEPCNYPP